MGGPWEDYAPAPQAATAGPWVDYAPAAPETAAESTAPPLAFADDGSGGVPVTAEDMAGNQGSFPGFAAKAANSALFNFGDEAVGAVGALPALFTDADYTATREGMRDRARGFIKDYEAADPRGAAIADVTGKGIGAMVIPGAVAGRMLGAAPGVIRATATGAALAAPGAALDAAGRIEGPASWQEYGDKTGEAAAYGAGIGGAFGGAGNVLGRVVGPWASAAAQRLSDRGVRLTPGEVLGGGAKRAEDIATSVPFVGNMVRNRQREGVESFNRVAWDEALAPLGARGRLPRDIEMGHEAQQAARQILNDAYDDVVPHLIARPDPAYIRDISGIRRGVRPSIRADFVDEYRHAVVGNVESGELTGRAMQDTVQNLRKRVTALRNQGNANEVDIADALDGVRNAILGAAERHSPAPVVDAYRATNAAYQRFATMRHAGAGVGTEAGVVSPAQLHSAVKAADTSTGKGQFARGEAPLQGLTSDAKGAMTRRVADSGTPERSALMGAMGTAGGIGAYASGIGMPSLMGAAGLAGLYTPAGNRMFQSLATFSPATRAILSRAIQQAGVRGGVAASQMIGTE